MIRVWAVGVEQNRHVVKNDGDNFDFHDGLGKSLLAEVGSDGSGFGKENLCLQHSRFR